MSFPLKKEVKIMRITRFLVTIGQKKCIFDSFLTAHKYAMFMINLMNWLIREIEYDEPTNIETMVAVSAQNDATIVIVEPIDSWEKEE